MIRRLCLCLLCMSASVQAEERYLTWVDEQGQIHNIRVDEPYQAQQRQAQQAIGRVRPTPRTGAAAGAQWPGAVAPNEEKRRYFTWIDTQGNIQNSFYASDPVRGMKEDYLLPNGQRSADYIDAEVLEGKSYQRNDKDGRYFTWTDERGHVQNSMVPSKRVPQIPPPPGEDTFTDGRQVMFDKPLPNLPGLGGQPTEAMQSLLSSQQGAGSTNPMHDELLKRCCAQIPDAEFSELQADSAPRLEEINQYSPSLDFPMGRSYYAALRLPRSSYTYGLRVRSFANHKVIYPTLLFLDETKRPTRLVSDAVYQLHPETWAQYAYIEGTVPVRAEAGERYVLLLTTEEDKRLTTLDNKPFKRPLEKLKVNESGMQTHTHADEGSFEVAVIKP